MVKMKQLKMLIRDAFSHIMINNSRLNSYIHVIKNLNTIITFQRHIKQSNLNNLAH